MDDIAADTGVPSDSPQRRDAHEGELSPPEALPFRAYFREMVAGLPERARNVQDTARAREVLLQGHTIPEDIRRVDRRFCEAVMALRDWSIPFDVHALLDSVGGCRFAVHLADVQEVAALLEAVSALTFNFDRIRLHFLAAFADQLAEVSFEVVAEPILKAQQEGAFGGVEGQRLLLGSAGGLAGALAPTLFLPLEVTPERGQGLMALSEQQYFLSMLVHGNAGLWFEYGAAYGVGTACLREITARRARYPRGAGVADAVAVQTIDELSRLVRTLRHWDQRMPNESDEVSIINETLAKTLAGSHPVQVMARALDGEYEFVSNAARCDLIDESRKRRAVRRTAPGGLTSLTELEEEGFEPRAEDPVDERNGSSRIKMLLSRIADRPELLRFVRSCEQDPGVTDRERATELGVTDRTLRNWRKKIASYLHDTD